MPRRCSNSTTQAKKLENRHSTPSTPCWWQWQGSAICCPKQMFLCTFLGSRNTSEIHIHIIFIDTCNNANSVSAEGWNLVALMSWRSNPHLSSLAWQMVAGMDHPKHTPGCYLSIHPVEPLRQVKSSGTFHLTLEKATGCISSLAASGIVCKRPMMEP